MESEDNYYSVELASIDDAMSIDDTLPLEEIEFQLISGNPKEWRFNISKLIEFISKHVNHEESQNGILSSLFHNALISNQLLYPKEFDNILLEVAQFGRSTYPWILLRFIFALKIESVFTNFDPPIPYNQDFLNSLRASVGTLWTVNVAPLGIRRATEILLAPTANHKQPSAISYALIRSLTSLNAPLFECIPPVVDRLTLPSNMKDFLEKTANPGPRLKPPPPIPFPSRDTVNILADLESPPRRTQSIGHDNSRISMESQSIDDSIGYEEASTPVAGVFGREDIFEKRAGKPTLHISATSKKAPVSALAGTFMLEMTDEVEDVEKLVELDLMKKDRVPTDAPNLAIYQLHTQNSDRDSELYERLSSNQNNVNFCNLSSDEEEIRETTTSKDSNNNGLYFERDENQTIEESPTTSEAMALLRDYLGCNE